MNEYVSRTIGNNVFLIITTTSTDITIPIGFITRAATALQPLLSHEPTTTRISIDLSHTPNPIQYPPTFDMPQIVAISTLTLHRTKSPTKLHATGKIKNDFYMALGASINKMCNILQEGKYHHAIAPHNNTD